MMSRKAILITGLVAVVCCRSPAAAKGSPSVVTSTNAPAAADNHRLIHEDTDFRFVAVNYGHTGRQVPGFYVFSKQHAQWRQITRVSTRNGVFGRSPTFDEVKQAGTSPPSVGWDFRGLEDNKFVSVPLHGGSFIAFPDKITLDAPSHAYVLSFHSRWQIAGVETVLRFSKSDLAASFNEGAPNKASEDIGAGAPNPQR